MTKITAKIHLNLPATNRHLIDCLNELNDNDLKATLQNPSNGKSLGCFHIPFENKDKAVSIIKKYGEYETA